MVGVAVLAAGAPIVASSAQDVDSSQELVDLAELNTRAITLAHSLADERDAMTEYVAAGRTTGTGLGVSEAQRSRVDRQVEDLREQAAGTSVGAAAFADAGKLLKSLPKTRQQGLAGPGSALNTFTSYSATIQALDAISGDIARRLPPRAASAGSGAQALPLLGRATDQASATRGLLLAALASEGRQPNLSAAAQSARLREQTAVADFRQTAGSGSRDSYDGTVNGGDVNTAERYLARLTDEPRLNPLDLQLNRERIGTSLAARIGLMRSVESSLSTADAKAMAKLRDDDVTALEVRIGLVGCCLLLAIGVSIWAARSMTQPLSALRRGADRLAKDPADEQAIAYKGRNDEYAQTVRSVNALHAKVAELAARTAEAEGEHTRMAAGRKRLAAERDVLMEERAELTERLAQLRSGVNNRFVSLAMRTVGLVERQLGVIESLEEREQDPERLDTLYKLDHFAARVRRNSENLLVLAGAEHSNHTAVPVPLLDVLRASISEIERYERVRIQSLPPHSQVAGFAADDISHLVSELLDNATAFSPPDAHVELSGWLLESGEVMLSVQDAGIGMTADRMAELNQRLSDPDTAASSETVDESLGLGLYVVVRLAARHGVRVQLRDQQQGGVTAVVVLPGSILPTRPAPTASASQTGAAQAGPNLPGSVAEANSNALPKRGHGVLPGRGQGAVPQRSEPAVDPLVEAAERTIEAAGLNAAPGPQAPQVPAQGGPVDAEGTPAAAAPEPRIPGQGVPGQGVPDFSGDPEAGGPQAGAAPAGHSPYAADDAAHGPYADGADDPQAGSAEHARPAADAPSAARHARPAPESGQAEAAHGDRAEEDGSEEEQPRRLTDMGLPKRTPRVVAQQQSPTAPRKNAGVNAEALRRRLGGFQQGARDGRRDVAAEIAERTAEQQMPHTDTDGAGAPGESHAVEEARD